MPETGDDRKRFAAVAIFVKASQDIEKPLVTARPRKTLAETIANRVEPQ